MIPNETWFEFMDRAKANGISPTMQETIDREKMAEGVSYFLKETIDIYGKETLRKITGNKHIEEKNEPNPSY